MTHEEAVLNRYERVISDSMQIQMHPFAMESQYDATMVGIDGDEVLDFFAAWAVGNTGYRHPRVIDAIETQLEAGYTNSALSIPHEPVVELAERLIDRTPGEFEKKVWFGHAGSDAGDLVARALPEVADGTAIISFEGSYHGGLSGSGAISGHGAQAGAGSQSVVTVPFPDVHNDGRDPAVVREDHLDAVTAALEEHDVAGVITEPLQSDAGIRVPPDGFLAGLEELCADHGAYFVLDEVKVGLGRTGSFFGFEHDDVVPDAVMLGKPLGSGLPISALVGRANLVDYEPATHMMTTAAAPLCAGAAHGTLDAIDEDNLVERAKDVGEYLQTELMRALDDSDAVADVRGRGLIRGVELVNPDTGQPSGTLTAKTTIRACQRGLLVAYVGKHSNVLELTPPLTIDRNMVDTAVQRLEAAIEDAIAGEVEEELVDRYVGW